MTALAFSVVIPTYNRASLLPRALDSIVAQTFRDYTAIIVDDCSTDSTPSVVLDYLADPRFVYHRNERNMGIVCCRNIGYDLGNSLLLTYLDDDDVLYPEALQTAYESYLALKGQGHGWIMFDRWDENLGDYGGTTGRVAGPVSYSEILCGRVKGNFWDVFERELIENPRLRHDERLHGNEGQLYKKIWKQHPPYYIPRVLYRMPIASHERHTATTTTQQVFQREITNAEIYLAEFGDDLRQLCRKELGRTYARLGYLYACTGSFRDSVRSHLRGLWYGSGGYGLRKVALSARPLAQRPSRAGNFARARARVMIDTVLDKVGPTPLVTLPGGCRIVIHERREYIQRQILKHGVYEPQVARLVSALAELGGTFFDIGANIGQHSLIALGSGMSVHSFEPEPGLFKRLAENRSINGMEARMTINQCAVSDTPGQCTLNVAHSGNEGAHSLLRDKSQSSTESVVVPAITVDGYLAALPDLSLPLVFKVDVEGWEARVLDGAATALEQKRATFILETGDDTAHAIGEDASTVLQRFFRNDYSVWEVRTTGELTQRTLPEIEARVANYLCVGNEQHQVIEALGLA
jgi:GalNAc5-diNAcBac-PP-undecaprenol beta-1,3-glucosyltransferase